MARMTSGGPSGAAEAATADAEETAEAPESAEPQAAPVPPSWVPPRQA